MLDDGALAVSLPALELAAFRLPGSIFSAARCRHGGVFARAAHRGRTRDGHLPRERVRADFCRATRDIYPRREPRLARQASRRGQGSPRAQRRNDHPVDPGAAQSRVSVRPRPRRRGEALQRLERRAPELSARCTAKSTPPAASVKRRETPAPIAISGVDALEPEAPQFVRLAINAESVEDSFGRTMSSGALLTSRAAFLRSRICRAHRDEPRRPRLRQGDRRETQPRLLRRPPRTDPAVAAQRRRARAKSRIAFAPLSPRWSSALPRVPWPPPTARCWRPADVSADRLAGIADDLDFVAHDSLRFLASFAAILPRLPQHLGACAGAAR